ncbi:MAG: hypothetical protein HQL32_06135, partial [Planctomycetes bacterium]|nr:hypothetical protein [Planctomycetota bacterium]
EALNLQSAYDNQSNDIIRQVNKLTQLQEKNAKSLKMLEMIKEKYPEAYEAAQSELQKKP